MKTQISLSESAGKTIGAVLMSLGSEIIISFTDGTFVYLTGSTGYENEPVINQDAFNILSGMFNVPDLIRIGLVTEEEVNSARARQAASNDEAERRMYNQLRAKYQ